MAALSRRDIEMIFRAETDKATRPIAELGKSVKAARGQLEDLIGAATATEAGLDKLGETTRDLKKAQDELGSARSLLTSLNSQEAALDKAQAKVAETGQKYRDLQERVAAADKPTKTLTNSMASAERAFNAAQEKLGQVAAEAAQTREQIEAIIGPVANVDASFREIANTSKEIARGLNLAGTAADEYKAKMQAAAGVDAKLNADVAFEQAGRNAGLQQAQIDYISQFENRVELLAQAKRELTAQNAAFDQALTAQEAKVGAANVEELRRGIANTFQEAQRVEQVNAFRQIAADANAAVSDVQRFGVAEDATAASTQRLAAAMRDILDPGRATKSTIDGIEESVTAAAGVLEGKGRKSLQEYNEAMNELIASGAGIGRIAQQIDAFKDQQAAVERSTQAFKEAQAEALKLAADLATTDTPTDQLAASLKKAEANVTTAGNEMQRQGTKAKEMGNALKQAGVDVNNLATAEARLVEQARAAAAAQAGIASESGGRVKGGLFGLNVHDATNLSYQLNDIFTQLASGQSIFITLAQQGPQIWQIAGIQAYIGSLGSLLPIIGLAVIAIGALAYALKQANDQAVEFDQARGYIAALGEQGSLSARQIAEASLELQGLGVAAEDARKLLADFNESSLDPKYLDAFTEAARNASELTGVDFKDAFGALTEAMNGGYAEIEKLLDQFPVLTDAERDHIKAMFDSGQESEARRIVFEKFYEKMGEGASAMRGPWSDAVRSFQDSFKGLFDYLSNVGIAVVNTFKSNMADALNGLNYLILRARGFEAETARLMVINGGKTPPLPGGGGPDAGRRTGTSREGQQAIREAREEQDLARGTNKALRDRARLEKAARDARRGAPKEATDTERAELAALAVAKERVSINAENAKIGAKAVKSAQTARDKAAREAQTLANKIDGQAEQLESALDAMGGKVAKLAAGTLTDQLAGAATAVEKQYAATLRKLDDFSKLTGGKGTIGGQSIADYKAEVEANKARLTGAAQLKVYEDNVNDTLAQRKALLADIEDRANRGQVTSAQAIQETAEVTSRFAPVISTLTTAAVAFAKSIGGAKPSAEISAFIDKMNTEGARASGDTQTAQRKQAVARLGVEESKLNTIISQRNSLVDSYNTLAQLGLLTADAARKKSADAYNAAKGEITEQSAVLRSTLEAAKASLDPQVYDAMIAKLQAVGAQAEYLDPRFAQLKQGIDNIVSQNAVDGILSIIQGFAEAAAGTQTWGDALRNAGVAVLDFIGQTLLMIGKLILQMLVLAAVQAATGIPVAALLGVMNGRGAAGGAGDGGGFSLFGLKLFHGGGTVGGGAGQQRTNRQISVSPATLAAAPRYHDGSPGVGLKSSEQLAVLERGEKVLTEEQQRREAATKAPGGSGKGLRQVLAFGDDQVAAAMAGPAGEDVTVTHLRRNVPLLKQLMQD